MDVLGKVWNLSDIDKDGSLDKEEFAVVRKYSLVKFLYFYINFVLLVFHIVSCAGYEVDFSSAGW